ncbi:MULTISPECIES: DUF7521 family protein [Natronorubrum]|uniref:Rhodopsin n=3 Tax=Natronorubrum TaxID=134813 RepID=L9W162_9EURY|nr:MULTISPECIES: hypothetical protein [Natronorubrum]ELY43072.1 hypothetical protein C495_14122 [Natronorubrum sulfidifaciens JCM 14089]ELY49758.1 hypothetical protein C494_07085 [Natronorubrum bangense JCM 10635]QCC55386.1 hypothetical protein DV706_13480 [Natronorubrum bangense]
MIPTIDPSIEAIVQGSLFIILTILGLAIIYLAFQGYRRNQSRPMLFLALGFAAIIVPELAMTVVTRLVEISQFWIVTTYQVTNVFAFCCILYAITMEP